jgi:thiamine pyrophosphate-dependent acetolactate synthase large subunit-like protein
MAGAKRPIIYSGGGVINSGTEASEAAARTGRDHRLSRSPRR